MYLYFSKRRYIIVLIIVVTYFDFSNFFFFFSLRQIRVNFSSSLDTIWYFIPGDYNSQRQRNEI